VKLIETEAEAKSIIKIAEARRRQRQLENEASAQMPSATMQIERGSLGFTLISCMA
jgi:hypothetical protein